MAVSQISGTDAFRAIGSDGVVDEIPTMVALPPNGLGGAFSRSAAVNSTPGHALWVQGVSTAGTINITLAGGGTLTPTVGLGSTLLPFAVTAATLGTAVGGTFQSLFLS